MSTHRIHQFLRVFSAVAGLTLAACSNPLATKTVTGFQNFRTPDQSCSNLNFSDSSITPKLLESLIHCLNSRHEIEAYENFTRGLSVEDLRLLSEILDETARKHPALLFKLNELYQTGKTNGDLSVIETFLQNLLQSPEENRALSSTLHRVAPLFSTWITKSDLGPSLDTNADLIRSRAFSRISHEIFEDPRLASLLSNYSNYLSSGDARTLQDIVKFISKSQTPPAWRVMMKNGRETKLSELSHFLNWLMTGNRFGLFTQGISALLREPVRCFSNQTSIEHPFEKLIQEMNQKSPKEAARFINGELKSLILTSQAYCTLPLTTTPIMTLLSEATTIPGFDSAYKLFLPLLSNREFVAWATSPSWVNWVNQNHWVFEGHLFQDLLVILSINEGDALPDGIDTLTGILDSTIRGQDPETLHSLAHTLNRISKFASDSKENSGPNPTEVLIRWGRALSSASFSPLTNSKESVNTLLNDSLQNPVLAPAFDLTYRLLKENKAEPILDQLTNYFSKFIEEGRVQVLERPSLSTPSTPSPWASILLEKFQDGAVNSTQCFELNLDWNFNQYRERDSRAYLQQLRSIQQCLDSRQTLKGLFDFAASSIENGKFASVLSIEKPILEASFQLDASLAIHTVKTWMSIPSADFAKITNQIETFSHLGALIRAPLVSASSLRRLLGSLLQQAETFSTMEESLAPPPIGPPTHPRLIPSGLERIKTQVTRHQVLSNALVEDGLKALFVEYCPTLNPMDSTCAIDSDQVRLYHVSPRALFQNISNEFLSSRQSWLHPRMQMSWTHVNSKPTQASQLEYHLNPLLNQLKGSVHATQSFLNALQRIKKDRLSLDRFLEERATRLTLIPYRFERPGFPNDQKAQFHSKIRIRMVSDLDRLELIAINADFKAFHFVENIGMGMIRDIGLAWGDVPEASRPKRLSELSHNPRPQTLAEVRDSIVGLLDRIDLSVWSLIDFNSEVSDLRARIFNLRFLVSLLDEELPESEGGHGGLPLLRDLFFSLYEANTANTLNHFGNSLSYGAPCLEDPSRSQYTAPQCQQDFLTLIPKIARLGVLHQSGVYELQNAKNSIPAVTRILDQALTDHELQNEAASLLSGSSGIRWIQNLIDLNFSSKPLNGQDLAPYLGFMAELNVTTWLKLLVEFSARNPEFLKMNSSLLSTVANSNNSHWGAMLESWVQSPTGKEIQWARGFVANLGPKERTELISILEAAFTHPSDLNEIAQGLLQNDVAIPVPLQQDLKSWIHLLASDAGEHSRSGLRQWVLGSDFNQFCDVFTDSMLTHGLIRALESLHQNPDSAEFFDQCRYFLSPR